MSEACYICDSGNGELLEEHHIVPRRFGGSDESENTVDLCPNCHRALERLYDKRFYDELGVEKGGEPDEPHICGSGRCKSYDTRHLVGDGVDVWACEKHGRCAKCGARNVTPIPSGDGEGAHLYCDDHRICNWSGCGSKDVVATSYTDKHIKPMCRIHAEEIRR